MKNLAFKFSLIPLKLNKERKSKSDRTSLILFCVKCKSVPIIKGINFNLKEAFVSCKCSQKSKKFDFFYIHYEFTEYLFEFKDKYFRCNYHKKEYRYYCENCGLNFCEKVAFFHKCHIKYLIDFEKLKYDIEEKINYINNCLSNLKNDDNDDNEVCYLKEIINIIFMQYRECPNYDIIKNINNIYLMFLKNRENSKEKLNVNKSCQKVLDLDFSNNQLYNIFFLLKKDLSNLKVLNLHNNKLCNFQINNLKKLNCYDLAILNLSNNFFTDYLLITIGETFLHLKELNLDTNRLYENIDILKNKLIVYDSLEKLILSNGVFSNQTINLLRCFKFTNLKYLDLSSNDLNSLSFIKLINFGNEENKIEKLILYYNEISINNEDIDYLLKKYLNLKLILEEDDYSIVSKRWKNLPFKILCFDDNRRTEYFFEQYDKKVKEDNSKSFIEYQQFCDNIN